MSTWPSEDKHIRHWHWRLSRDTWQSSQSQRRGCRGAPFRIPCSWLSVLPVTKASKGRSSSLHLGGLGSGHSFVTTMGSWEIVSHLEVSFFSKMWIWTCNLQGSCEDRMRYTCATLGVGMCDVLFIAIVVKGKKSKLLITRGDNLFNDNFPVCLCDEAECGQLWSHDCWNLHASSLNPAWVSHHNNAVGTWSFTDSRLLFQTLSFSQDLGSSRLTMWAERWRTLPDLSLTASDNKWSVW